MVNDVSIQCLAANDVYLDECINLRKSYEINKSVLDLREDLGVFWEGVKNLALSKLPNDYFLQQFSADCPEPFSQKKYWHGFAVVLAYRGIEKIWDVKEKLFFWFKDANWPGNFVIKSFVFQHKEVLKDCFVNTVWDAFDRGDIPWFWYMINTFIEFYAVKKTDLNSIVEEIFKSDEYRESWGEKKSRFESKLSELFPKAQAQTNFSNHSDI